MKPARRRFYVAAILFLIVMALAFYYGWVTWDTPEGPWEVPIADFN